MYCRSIAPHRPKRCCCTCRPPTAGVSQVKLPIKRCRATDRCGGHTCECRATLYNCAFIAPDSLAGNGRPLSSTTTQQLVFFACAISWCAIDCMSIDELCDEPNGSSAELGVANGGGARVQEGGLQYLTSCVFFARNLLLQGNSH